MQYYDFPTCQNLSHVHIPTSKGQKKNSMKCLLEHDNQLLCNTLCLAHQRSASTCSCFGWAALGSQLVSLSRSLRRHPHSSHSSCLTLLKGNSFPLLGKEFPAWQLHGWTLEPLKMVELSRMWKQGCIPTAIKCKRMTLKVHHPNDLFLSLEDDKISRSWVLSKRKQQSQKHIC